VNILGVAVHAVHMESAVAAIEAAIESGTPGYVCVTGVHGVMESQNDEDLKLILNRAFLNVPDGMPTVWVGRLKGHRTMARVFGPELMLELCRRSVRHGFTHFLYGGKPGVAQELAESLRNKVPGIKIVGTYTPPFRALTSEEESGLFEQVALAKPDYFWVGLSTPKQERFMAKYHTRLQCKVLVGVGAAFDYHTGRIKDAPAWMKNAGLQWVHRLGQDPRRLWKRYATNNPKFILAMIAQLMAGESRFPIR